MSFADYDLEAQRSQEGSSREGRKSTLHTMNSDKEDELTSVFAQVSHQLQVFSDNISTLDSLKKRVGSRRDCLELRNNIDALINRIPFLERAIRPLIDSLTQVVEKLNDKGSEEAPVARNGLRRSAKYAFMKERLSNEFNELSSQFSAIARSYKEKKKAHPIEGMNRIKDTENTPLIKDQENQDTGIQIQQQEQIDESELQYHILLTQERDREIQRINKGINEINTIFKDLGNLVHEQGEQLDRVEDNLLNLNDNTQSAKKELNRAHENQKRRSKWSCIFLVALTIFALIVVLAIVS